MKVFKRLSALATAGVLFGFVIDRLGARATAGPDAERRGRNAASPAQMTWTGWKDILVRTWEEMFQDRLLSVAAGVAFFGLMALVPSLSVLVSIYGLVADPSRIDAQLAPLFGFMPDSAVALISEQAHRLAAQPNHTLSFNLMLSLVLAVWSANAGIKALFDALNVIYEEEEKRSFLRLNAVSLLTTTSAAILLVLIILIVALVPVALARAPFSAAVEMLLGLARWPAFFVLTTVAIAVLFWIGPSRKRARFVWVLPGAAAAALLWALVSAAFSFYVSTLGNYQVTYGSLSTVIVFMTWLWLSASVILLGAELNSELEHQTHIDTTEGMPRPMGLRGATMADNVGAKKVED